jgi:8-oxo-dGTP pyrophosphatase MutT (NUDIX family)
MTSNYPTAATSTTTSLTFPKTSQAAVVLNEARDHVLLIWRHRFISDTWGWEVPAGWVEPGEEPEAAIRREIEEETGYQVGQVEPLVSYNAISGISTMHFTAYLGQDAVSLGDSRDADEVERVEWIEFREIPTLVRGGAISDGPSLTALSYYLALQ